LKQSGTEFEKEVENGGFSLKTHQIFSVFATPEESETQFAFDENSAKKIA